MVNNTIIYIHVRYKLWDGFGSNLIRKMLFCFFWWIYYSYYAGNPVSRVDPNGRDFWDVLKGIGVSISDNATLGGVNRRGTIAYKDASDYNLGQNIGDALSVIIGGGEAFTGMGGTIFGTGISATGVGAVVGAPVMAEGALMTAHGTLMMFSAGKNLNSQKGRVDESSSVSKGRSNMKENGIPNSSLIQKRNSKGKIIKYSTYDSNGKIIKEYRGEGKPHGNIKRPNVKEPQYNVNPKTGEVFQNQPKVREAYPDEIPR